MDCIKLEIATFKFGDQKTVVKTYLFLVNTRDS
jgi:hypothetical protein